MSITTITDTYRQRLESQNKQLNNSLLKLESYKSKVKTKKRKIYNSYVTPRHLLVYSYISVWNRLIQSNQGRVVCGSLKDVQCHLHYTDVISSSKAKYDYDYHDSCEKSKENIQECLTNGIISACDKKYKCDETKIGNTYCFFKPFRIEITYSCDQGK